MVTFLEAIKINIDEYINAISSLSIFSGFTKDEINKVFSSSKYEIKEYGKEQIIHLENELCSTMDIILNGQTSVQNIDQNGNILKINTFTSKDIIGVNLIFARRNYYPMTVVAASKVTMLHMEKELILELCNNRNFMIELMTAISDKTIILTDKIKTISMKTIRQCIIDFLKYEYHIQNCNVIKLNTSKKDLAERLGIQRSSLSRELNKMRRDGLLEYDARTITLKNIDI